MIKRKIILASASPRREKLLRKIIPNFEVVVSGVDENKIRENDPLVFVKKAAFEKALAVSLKDPQAVILGADTMVLLDHHVLGKPQSRKEAILMLEGLSGSCHEVVTGIAIILPTGKKIIDAVMTKVWMNEIEEKDILFYVDSGLPMDKAGAYGIQEIDQDLILKIDGDYDNVIGLPVERIGQILKEERIL